MLMDRKEILRLNNTLISEFVRKKAVDRQNSICCDEIKIGCDEKIKRFLIQELIKQGFVYNVEDNKVWFEHKKWKSEYKKTYIIYYGILLLPVISGLLLIILRK